MAIPASIIRVPLRQLRLLADAALELKSFPPRQREVVLDVLMYAQMRGNSQNVVKLISGGIPKHEPTHEPVIASNSGSAFRLDGRGTLGIVRSSV
jgi:hypothetical protein